MADEELEKRLRKIEDDIRILKFGSNNPAILASLQVSLKEIQDEQAQINKRLRAIAKALMNIQEANF